MKLDFAKLLANAQEPALVIRETGDVVYRNAKALTLTAAELTRIFASDFPFPRQSAVIRDAITGQDGVPRPVFLSVVRTFTHDEPLYFVLFFDAGIAADTPAMPPHPDDATEPPPVDLVTALDQAILAAIDGSSPHFTLTSVVIRNFAEIVSHTTEKDREWMLQDVTRTIRKVLRRQDRLVFPANGRFFVLLAETDKTEATYVAKRIASVTKNCFCPAGGGRVFLDVTVAFASYPEDGVSAETLLDKLA